MDDFNNLFGTGSDNNPEPEKQNFTEVNEKKDNFNPNAGFPYGNYQQNTQGGFNQPKTYYTPQAADPLGVPKKKKNGNKATVVIVIIAVICAIIAISGLGMAGRDGGSSSDKENKTTTPQSSEQKTDDNDVTAKNSEEAAKKDNKGNLTAAGVAEKSKSSCVGITVYTDQSGYSYYNNFDQGSSNGEKQASGEGSGVIMKESGGKTYIMTCAHVIADASDFKVTLDNNKEYDATMVGYDSKTDIGVIAINATGLDVAEFGDSKDIEVGEDCIAIGCPGGLQFKNSVTKGIVSALDVPVSSQIGYDNMCIQVDAAINPGNSGGALFNMQGQVIGINSSKIASTEYEGMGFAVPSNTALDAANSLIKNGYVAGRAKLGVQYNTLENYRSASAILSALNKKGFKDAKGAMVIREIDSDSDLKNKDVREYDMIVAVEGKTMTSTDVMTSLLAKKKPGDTVKITIARIDGNSIKTFEVSCKLVEEGKSNQ